MTPTISVIVPAWNAGPRITTLLKALEAQTAPRERFEVIVVDNGSSDDTAERARRFAGVRLLSEPQPGSYRARNRALAAAAGEHCLFTDGDCVPAPDWVEAALRLVGSNEGTVHAGHITLFREAGAGRFTARLEALDAFNQAGNVAQGYGVTANWLCPRALLKSVGGFRADLLSGGDVDASRRIVDAGGRIAYAPDMVVGHPVRSRLLDLVSKRRRVLGGLWTMAQGKPLRPIRMLRNVGEVAARQQARILRADMPMHERPGVIAVSLAVTAAGLAETARLALGGAPHRS